MPWPSRFEGAQATAKELTRGWFFWFTFWLGALMALSALAVYVSKQGSFWMWLAAGAVSVAAYCVWRYHTMRTRVEVVESENDQLRKALEDANRLAATNVGVRLPTRRVTKLLGIQVYETTTTYGPPPTQEEG